jgi:2-keto-3-deoxy-L-fuconate dehydrogenase
MLSLQNKTAVITGGGSGIGKSISVLFAAQGAQVHILDMDADGSAKVVDEIAKAGGKATAHKVNVTNQDEVS